MSDSDRRTLNDEEIQDFFRANDDHFRATLREVRTLTENVKSTTLDTVEVSVESLVRIQQTMSAMYKIMAEQNATRTGLVLLGGDHGDRGPGADWSVFGGMNVGDFYNSALW